MHNPEIGDIRRSCTKRNAWMDCLMHVSRNYRYGSTTILTHLPTHHTHSFVVFVRSSWQYKKQTHTPSHWPCVRFYTQLFTTGGHPRRKLTWSDVVDLRDARPRYPLDPMWRPWSRRSACSNWTPCPIPVKCGPITRRSNGETSWYGLEMPPVPTERSIGWDVNTATLT